MLIHGDSLTVLKNIKNQTIDVIFADPPYFLSGDGLTFKNGKVTSVKKAEWDKPLPLIKMHEFNNQWIRECYRILKPGGTIWITGTFHNIYSVGMSLLENNFKILNHITWVKPSPPPNFSHKTFTHSTEQIIWAKKNNRISHFYNYSLMTKLNYGKQMKDVWKISPPDKTEKRFGKHPTQKPLQLLERIILASSTPHQIVLDPFAGSGTTGVAAVKYRRFFIGIEKEKEYIDIASQRIYAVVN